MNLVGSYPIPAVAPACILEHMGDSKQEVTAKLERQFVKLTPEVRRRLIHLSVDADAKSVEVFGGELLTQVVNRLWEKFDPKRDGKAGK